MCGWQDMIKSLSMEFELQQGITFTSQGQMKWGFLEQFSLDMSYHKQALHFMNSHHKKIELFIGFEFENWRENITLKNRHGFHIIPLALA
jgi:hypothetical protein